MECQYCYHFQHGKTSYKTYKDVHGNNQNVVERECLATAKSINPNDSTAGCSNFVLAKRFWCQRYEMWIELKVCQSNKQKRQAGCVTCRQGKIINKILTPQQPKSRFMRRATA